MTRFFLVIWQISRTKFLNSYSQIRPYFPRKIHIFQICLFTVLGLVSAGLVYFHDIPIFSKLIIIFTLLYSVCLFAWYGWHIGAAKAKHEFIERQNELIKDYSTQRRDLLDQWRHLVANNFFPHIFEYITRRKRENRFYVASKSAEGSKWIPIDNISLFVAEQGMVKAFVVETGSIKLEYDDLRVSLDQLELKIKESGWNRSRFLRVSSDILINLSAIAEWNQSDKDRIVLYLKGCDQCETVIFEENKRQMARYKRVPVKAQDGLILPQPKKKKYEENQDIVKESVSQRRRDQTVRPVH